VTENHERLNVAPCGDSRYCPVGNIKDDVTEIKKTQEEQEREYRQDVKEIKASLAEQRELLSNFKTLSEAITTIKTELLENRRTFSKLFDRADDLQKTKAGIELSTKVDALERQKADTVDMIELMKKVDSQASALSDRPTRREIFSLVASLSIVIGIIFTVINFTVTAREARLCTDDIREVIRQELKGKDNVRGTNGQ
jgi:hypothetical protein